MKKFFLKNEINREVISLFPSFIFKSYDNEFNSIDFVKYVYSVKKEESVLKTNVGGWQSKGDFFYDKNFSNLKDYIIFRIKNTLNNLFAENCDVHLLNMWINLNYPGSYNSKHVHPGADLSGVLWILAEENSGDIIFDNSHIFDQHHIIKYAPEEVRKKFNFDYCFSIAPTPGTMLIFPSNMLHEVRLNNSKKDRISIAFNLKLSNLQEEN